MTVDLDTYPIIDADTHIIEPPDLWTSRVSRKWGDQIPHVKWDESSGEELWYFGGKPIYSAAVACGAGWSEYPPDHPRRLADADPRTYDPVERLKHMDEYGIQAQVLYPNIGIFAVNEYLGTTGDPGLVFECVRAYNDFLAEWSDAAPGRYVPLMTIPFWDMDAALAEMRRAADIGHKGIVFPARMGDFKLPDLGDGHWDPLWRQAQDMQLSINFHIGSGDIPLFGTPTAGRRLNYAWTSAMLFTLNVSAVASVIFGGVCQRFPNLQLVSVESGVGWIPFFLEAMDWQWRNTGAWLDHPEFELLPSEYFARQIYSCFWYESASARAAIEILGAEHVLFETDFPHPVGLTPGPASAALPPREHLKTSLIGVPDEDIEKVLWRNAQKLYHLDN
jgi:predicted TIM-barrel fold metal-dependent hydrolase